jgi:hypothetical protein
MLYQVLELMVIMRFSIFRWRLKRSFPVSNLFERLAAIVFYPAVVDEKFSGDRFSFVWE